MRTSDDNESSSPITPTYISDLDRPFTDEELVAIDAAFLSATTSTDPCHVTTNPTSSTPFETSTTSALTPMMKATAAKFVAVATSSLAQTAAVRSCRRLPHSISAPDPFSPSSCSRTRFFNLSAPAKLRYSTLTFKGHIAYSRSAHEVDEAAKELIQFVEVKKKEDGQAILGFDIEWKPTFRRGMPPGKAAVMQICGDSNRCYVMHIIHSGIPKSLQSLLEDDCTIKVGVCIANDGNKVSNDYNVAVKALEDLSNLANRKLGGDKKKWSLASLAETIICKKLPKPGNIRLGNWEADTLSKEKLEYAATDAFASWYLYQALKSLPEATQKLSTMKVEKKITKSLPEATQKLSTMKVKKKI